MKNVKIIVATHKSYQMPEEQMYIPIHVGKEGKKDLGYIGDNTGEHISHKNNYYCELTGIYWAWKNLDAEYIGLCHYRRYFTEAKRIARTEEKKFTQVLHEAEVQKILENTDIVLPKKRRYFIENLYDHYRHTLHEEPLLETRKIIEEKYPQYLEEFDRLHKRTSAHMFNMFIMKKDVLDAYCTWLFAILFELEKRCDPAQYEAFHARYLGRISELLLDIWINQNQKEYEEVKVMDMQKVNWLKKGSSFLQAKFIGKKYDKSF